MLSLKTYLKVSAVIFAIVTLVHLFRLLLGWTLLIGQWNVPLWVSVVGVVVGAWLSYSAYELADKKKK